jgi:hypothetical protein
MPYDVDEVESDLHFTCAYKGHILEPVDIALIILVVGVFEAILVSLLILAPSTEYYKNGFLVLVIMVLIHLAILVSLFIELLWQFTGKEEIEVSQDRIAIKHRVFGITSSRRFASNQINGVFLTEVRETNITFQMLTRSRLYGLHYFKHGKVSFYSGQDWLLRQPNIFCFGTGLTFSEAKEIVSMIHRHYPQYQRSSNWKVLEKQKAG